MSDDDANDGGHPGECPGHEWVTLQGIAASDGGYVEQQCRWCDAALVIGPRELGGWV